MKPVFYATLVSALLLLAGCGSESSLPNPTGKGSIRAINAINTSPTFGFLIEERTAGSAAYQEATAPQRFDDFEYRFNFEVVLAGRVEASRVASVVQKIDANQEYTFVLTGSIDAPNVLVWDKPQANFADTDTAFEIQVAHLAEGFPSVDVFIAAEGVPPSAGQEVATIAFGNVMPVREFESGDYVVTVTAAGDPGAVLFESDPVTFGARNSLLVGVFAPTGNDVSPLAIRGFTDGGTAALITERNSSPTLRVIHSAQDLGNVDVYNDEALTDVLATDVAFKGVTGDLPIAAGNSDIKVTPAGSTASVLVEAIANISAATRNNVVLTGTGGTYAATGYVPDRTSVQTFAKLSLFNGASNFDLVDIYAVETGTLIEEDTLARAVAIPIANRSTTAVIPNPGTYDFYVTRFTEEVPVAGPLTRTVARGDIIELFLFDTASPDVGELVEIPAP